MEKLLEEKAVHVMIDDSQHRIAELKPFNFFLKLCFTSMGKRIANYYALDVIIDYL